ncbi:hemicentin-1-like isoform X2 [Acropora palmata]|uniref:hemicentin-1-like isoform X2 n=1 Tax=Acropora palmata TaxID=6131 RepID=UPI003DA1A458
MDIALSSPLKADMIVFVRFCLLLFPVSLVRETESQVIITSKPPNPVRGLEGQPLTLNWTFSAGATLFRVELAVSGSRLALVELSPGSTRIRGIFSGRVDAIYTETNATITFSSLNKTDAATYDFIVIDEKDASAQVTLQLIVQYPPSLITRASDQVSLEGDPEMTLTCTADGVPAPNITWTEVFANGSDSDVLVTDEQFTLLSSRTSDGTYRCKASNGIGSDVNQTVNVTVNFKPEKFVFTVESSNKNICKGDIINITCSAVGKPVVHTYQLIRDDTPVHTSSDSVLFWRQNTTASGETVYTCVANNTVATANATKAITVNERSAVEKLENVTTEEGKNATLYCNVTGIPMPSVSWEEVKTGSRFYENPLVFTNVSRKQAGEYICHASNACGNDSMKGILSVNYPPEGVQLQVSEGTGCKGANVIFTCSAADANPMELTYDLYENNFMGINSSSTGIWNRTMTTGGKLVYSCKVTNIIGTAMSTDISVIVNEQSAIEQLKNVTTMEGRNATLNCSVTGIPVPSVFWEEVKTGSRFSENPLVFTNVSRKQAGEYICHASNACGNDSMKGILSVNYPPEGVQLQVSDDTVCKGANVIFSCSAADANPMELTYHLYENNVMVINSSSTGIWNRTMTTGGVFVYSCKVTNVIGTAMSTNVSVTVNVLPSILPIDNETVIEGQNVTLTCNASGFPTPTVYWVKTSNGDRFNETELVFTNISRSEAGEYTCVASNLCTSTEVVEVDVLFPPEIVKLVPSKTTACQGEIVTFSCSANSNPAVHTYQLYVNGTMVNETSSSGVWNKTMITGGVFVYKCKVTNRNGTAMSENVTITVNVPPSILPIGNETIIEGGNVTLTCNASGFPAPTVYWVKTSNRDRFNGTELVLTSINRSEAGEYKCVASNPCNTTTELTDIDVQFPPEMVKLVPSKTTVCQREIIIFNCSAHSNPAVHTYQWYVNETMVNEVISTGVWNRTMTTGGVFVYKCKVNNSIGAVMSENVTITVNEPPSILPFTRKEVTEGGNLTVMCNVSGIPPPTVFWVKTSNGERTNGTDLVFTSINRTQSGDYTCKASNPCGDATQSAEIDVQFKPEMVQLMASKTTVCKGESIVLNCSANSEPAVHSYQLYKNGTMVNEVHSRGVWFLTMATGGVFVYKCKVTNSVGTAMSENVSITVNEPATIEKVEKSTVAEGGYLTLSCQVSGDPFPSVSWVKVMGGERFNGSNLSLRNVNGNASGEYRCEAANLCSSVSSVSSVTVVDAPKITHISAPHILSTGEVLTLNCTADGNPEPNITWTRLPNGETVNMPLTVTGKKYVEDYRCTASNGIGTVSKDTSVTRGYCEETCEGGRTCRVGLCRCTDGKTGDTCEITEQPKKRVLVGIVFTMTFKAVYDDLGNPETKALIVKIEVAVKVELSGTGVTQVRVASLKEGSVIADLELTFSSSTYEDYLRGRLQDATKDNKLGDLDVKQVVVGRFISPDEPEQTCSPFFEGKDCTRAAGTLIALIVVGVILAVALLIGLVICCFHKKNASGRGSFQNVKVTQRQDPEGNNSLARDYVEPGGSRETLHGNVNTGYDPERPPESTQMATFSSNNGRVEGIHLKDSRSQQT